MTAFAIRIVFSVAFTACLMLAPVVSADDVPSGSQAIQAQLEALNKQLMAAKKQAAIKKAAIKIARQRSAEIQKMLQESKQRMEATTKALQTAEKQAAEKTKQIAVVAAELKKHKNADSLLAVAADIKRKADAAEATQTSLKSQLAELKKTSFEQQQRNIKATAALKTAKEQLPKQLEELKKARAIYDTHGQAVDVARMDATKAQDATKLARQATHPEIARLQKAKAALTTANASVKTLETSLAKLREAAKTAGTDPEEAGREVARSVEDAKMIQSMAARLVTAAEANVKKAQKNLKVAEAALKTSNESLQQAQKKYALQSRVHFKIQLVVADLQNGERAHQNDISDSKTQQEQIAAKQKELEPQIAAAAGKLEELQNKFFNKQQVAEKELESLGRFVSFSRDIAPIFASRCVACHNTRTASGRLNMDSFAGLLKGGESGATITAHHAEDSLLWNAVEDGSMPKDTDPLAKNEIALIKKWINLGAPLDAGTIATADLFQVMPEISQPLPPETYRVPIPVTATAFNTDAGILASSGYHEILLWKTADGSLLRRITNVAERVYDLEFSKDGSKLVVAAGTPGQLGEVKVFATDTGKHLKTLVRTRDAVFAVAFSPDDKQIAAGGADRIVYTADVASGETILQIEDHADWVMDVNWSPDGRQLVTASRDKTSKVFDAATGSSSITFNGHGDAVYSAAFLMHGKGIVSAGSDRHARVWNPADAKEIRKIGGFGNDIFRVTVTPENHLFTACADRNAREHNLEDGKEIRKFEGHKDWVYTLCYNSSKNLIATGSYDGEIRVWNSTDGSMATSFIAIPKAGKNASVASAED